MATKTPIDFSIGYQNIDGLHTKSFSCKLPYIQKKFIHDFEILTETWGSCEHNKEIDGYQLLEIEPQKEKGISKGRASGGYSYTVKAIFSSTSKNVIGPLTISG